MRPDNADTDDLMARATRGDAAARQELLERYRDRLHKMISVRLDRRLAARIDPSDVVQEAIFDASQMLSGYLAEPPLPFYPWLRRLAWKRLVKMHHRHLGAQRRSAAREEQRLPALRNYAGSIFPGLKIFCGSSARFTARMASMASMPISALRYFCLP